ncbi:hypothetical protein FACS1894133_4860 [Clostridia bacterium]|nr:hypothetical protein FACS1894133_4860 [Clostridia bacterium]
MNRERKYKDTLFRYIFKEPEQAIRLYNLVADKNYDINTPIEVNALEKAVFSELENDVSFVIEDKLVIFIEHQSTINNNMPLRFVEYLAANYSMLEGKLKYREKSIRLPKPEFYVLYNGTEVWDKEYLRLSDSFGEPEVADTYVELVAKVIDIKPDSATVDIKRDNELYVYSVFVAKVQELRRAGAEIRNALKTAYEFCAEQGLHSTMLNKWAEVEDMYLAEFSYFDDVRREAFFNGELKKAVDVIRNLMPLKISVEQMSKIAEVDVAVVKDVIADRS